MDEQNQAGAPQKYTWPKYVLAGVVLGIVLAIIWMAALVHRIRGQREDLVWPTNAAKPAASAPASNSVPSTNSTASPGR